MEILKERRTACLQISDDSGFFLSKLRRWAWRPELPELLSQV